MAKSARASTKKASRSKLRSSVHAPVERARTDRLSAKLLALASEPLPEKPIAEDVDMDAGDKGEVMEMSEKPVEKGQEHSESQSAP
ncbi:MAG: hypothetical protein M1829_004510 [Trizodia sp. TS-e1964]|nr:MAG: hypothetical protein M1829_004510 [Trizodia sp. TS-e1964]